MSEGKIYRPGQSLQDNTQQFQQPPENNQHTISSQVGGVVPVPQHEDKYRGMWMQYLGTENIGLSDKVERSIMVNGKLNILFESGLQLTVDELNKLCVPIDIPGDIIPQLQEKYGQKPPDVLGVDNSISSSVSPIKNSSPVNVSTTSTNTNPIVAILEKKKYNPVSLTVNLELDLPSKNLYNMLLEDFDATPNDIFLNCLTDKNLELLSEQISLAILQKYNPDYVIKEVKEENGESDEK